MQPLVPSVPEVPGTVPLDAVGQYTASHPLSVYGPAVEHASAAGEPAYPATHAPPVKDTAKFGMSNTSDSMA